MEKFKFGTWYNIQSAPTNKNIIVIGGFIGKFDKTERTALKEHVIAIAHNYGEFVVSQDSYNVEVFPTMWTPLPPELEMED